MTEIPIDKQALEAAIRDAIFDPGAEVGMKHDRTLTEWQTDAVMNALARLASLPQAGKAEPAFFAWRWASSDEWRPFASSTTEAGRADFIRHQEKIAPIVVKPFFASPTTSPQAPEGVRDDVLATKLDQWIADHRKAVFDGAGELHSEEIRFAKLWLDNFAAAIRALKGNRT